MKVSWQQTKQPIYIVLLSLLLLQLIIPPQPARADEPVDNQRTLRSRILELKAKLQEVIPTSINNAQAEVLDGTNVPPFTLKGDMLKLKRGQSSSEVTQVDLLPALTKFPLPDLSSPMVRPNDLQKLGTSELTRLEFTQPRDLDDPFNPINQYAPFGLIAGASAVDLGLVYSGGAFGPNSAPAIQFCPQCFDPYYFSRGEQSIADVLNSADSATSWSLNLLTALNGGNWNQFLGQLPNPGGWNASFSGYDPFFSGVSSYSSDVPLTIQAVLGYDPSSSYSFGTQYLLATNNYLYDPWTSTDLTGIFSFKPNVNRQANNDLAARYLALGEQQLNLYYTDEALSELRALSNTTLIYYMYNDPLYLYWNYELSAYLEQIYISRPSYATLSDLASEVASWDASLNDNQTLADHYDKRLLLEYYNAYLEYEVLLYIYSTPGVVDWINQVSNFLTQRLVQNWSSQEATNWYSSWSNQWLTSYEDSASYNNLIQQINQINSDYPTFEEYLQLNGEVVDLLPSFSGLQPVQNINNEIATVFASQSVSQQMSQYYNNYTDQVDTLLATTNFNIELERYYEQLNGLVYNDELYDDLSTIEYLVILNTLAFQQNVHDAVANCYYLYGNTCNPYTDPAVVQLYYQVDQGGNNIFLSLMDATGLFYEIYNLYWYDFYTNNPNYQTLEDDAQAAAQSTLAPISSNLEAARTQFNSGVNSISEVKHLRTQMNNLVSILRGQTTTGVNDETLAALADTSSELDWRLSRMAELAAQLEGRQKAYLPVVIK